MLAQPSAEGASEASFQLGPLTADPRLAITNVGVDTNVLNVADGASRDATATIGPEVDTWLRAGRLGWSGTSAALWTYFRDTRSQRSVDLSQSGRLELDLQRLLPFVRGSVGRARQRPNLEIDARVRRETTEGFAGLDLLIGARSWISAEHGVRELRYDDRTDAGAELATALDRRETRSSLRAGFSLTPLTTLVIGGEARRDRFGRTPDRNSDTVKVDGGLELRPLALISGRATAGVRRFEPVATTVQPFTGAVADVALVYQLRDMTRLSGLVQRDVDYSFDEAQAYYVSTAWTVSMTQIVGAGFDVVARVGRTGFDYRAALPDAILDGDTRRDVVDAYGLGVGRRLGTEVRVGVDLEYVTRRSNRPGRNYEGMRGGGSFSYGF